ncbi:hypothetical protein WI87_14015 [Burkholderia ubonensis]|uniref:EAL domain-containing protein n=1 Tax=Burkholderia ubonensis TaxID=101571 RepID=UPI000753975B|nr:EAL domain-containing protein [Burkholderia ubonensis]KVD59169.1 hypothetical protein WI87_14015 [Burkholderia ubonensis]
MIQVDRRKGEPTVDLARIESLGERRRESDVATVSRVHAALECGRFEFAFQAVHCARGRRPALYQECLARVSDSNCTVMPPNAYLPSLARLGLTGWFDGYVLRQALKWLRQFPNLVVGVNVSAASLIDAAVWEPMWAELEGQPGVACRLTLEITETTPMYGQAGGLCVGRFRQLGCRIAIDDFGAGFSVETALKLGAVDLVKIDHGVFALAGDALGLPRLERLMALAAEVSSSCVVEGIETEADLVRARRIGAEWVQGYYFGQPARAGGAMPAGVC